MIKHLPPDQGDNFNNPLFNKTICLNYPAFKICYFKLLSVSRRGNQMELSPQLHRQLLTFQRNEITEYYIYNKLAIKVTGRDNRQILSEIAEDEKRHYDKWYQYTQQRVKPNRFKIWKYYLISRLFGITFGIKLMERGEESAQESYALLNDTISEVDTIIEEEETHEQQLIDLLDEERLNYTGSIVLGLNDALVELTGALAGLTLALQNTQLIALSASITGIAAALSMGASEYLSTKSEQNTKHPVKASLYTGATYLVTVILLVLPYLLLADYYLCLTISLIIAVAIIAFYNYYISVSKDLNFNKRFLEMAGLSLSIAALSFLLGIVLRIFFSVEI